MHSGKLYQYRLLDALRYAVPVPLHNCIISPSRDAVNDSGTIPKGTEYFHSGSKGCRSVSLINHSHLVLRFRLLLCSCSVHGCSPVHGRAFARLMLGEWWIAVSSCGYAALWRWDSLFLLCRDNEMGTSCVGRAAAAAAATASSVAILQMFPLMLWIMWLVASYSLWPL